MRFLSYYNPGLRIGVIGLDDDVIIDVQRAYELRLLERFHDATADATAKSHCPVDMSAFVAQWTGRTADLQPVIDYVEARRAEDDAWLRAGGIIVDRASVRLLPPVLSPTKIVNIGNAYLGHILKKAELAGLSPDQAEVPEEVKVSFFKPASCLIAHGQTIRYPADSPKWDFEGELVIVIGRHAHQVSEEDAMRHVFGFSILNDVSDRSITPVQGGNTSPNGKGPDTFGPMGPWVVPLESMTHPYSDLKMQTFVNGEVWQDSRTSDLLWPIERIVAAASRRMTLVPGDLIATGSPPGMGLERGLYLKAGDVVRIEVEGVGVLENPVAQV